MLRKISALSLVLLFVPLAACQFATAQAQTSAAPATTSLDSLKFLVGKWIGEGTAETGQGGGGHCSFEPGLQGKVLIRKNHSEYPAAKDHPAIVHDDLMIIYADNSKHQLRAFYTDNEGHVIHYTVSAAPGGKSAIFLGDIEPGAPRYRLTYTITTPGHMTIDFKMAPPSSPGQFQKFISGKLRLSSSN
ncbi:MAG TPA: hypothetical protein VGR81_13050 [Candidatus Acidoferrales bacterium]|nr:hypothetical protein [Candidatus Acidoferrales bacterium]